MGKAGLFVGLVEGLITSARALLSGISCRPTDHVHACFGESDMTEARSRSALKLGLGIFIGVLLTLLVVAGVVVYVVGCTVAKVGEALQTDTKVGVRPTTTNGRLELDLTYGNEATQLNTLTVTDAAGNTLWEVSGAPSAKPAKIVCGQIPADGSIKQVFPADGSPPADIRGKTVHIRVFNGFRVAFGPGQEVTDVSIEVPK
jgi:hypothetical protein